MSEPAATYQPDLSRVLDRMRFDLGDTNTAAYFLPDITYTAMLTAKANDERAATIALAEALITKYAQMPSKVATEGGADVTWANRLAGWQALAARLRDEITAEDVAATNASAGVSYTVRVRGVW